MLEADGTRYYFAFLPDFGHSACSATGDTVLEAIEELDLVRQDVIRYFIEAEKKLPKPMWASFEMETRSCSDEWWAEQIEGWPSQCCRNCNELRFHQLDSGVVPRWGDWCEPMGVLACDGKYRCKYWEKADYHHRNTIFTLMTTKREKD